MDALLHAHAMHMSSPVHAAEVHRARRLDVTDAQAIEEKRHRFILKCEVDRMRSQRRQMMAMHRRMSGFEIGSTPQGTPEFWQIWEHKLAKLDARLDEATARHGYGRTSIGFLQAPRAKQHVEQTP